MEVKYINNNNTFTTTMPNAIIQCSVISCYYIAMLKCDIAKCAYIVMVYILLL